MDSFDKDHEEINSQQEDETTIYKCVNEDISIAVVWFDPLKERFPNKLVDIAERILNEVYDTADSIQEQCEDWNFRSPISVIVPFEDESIFVIASWDYELGRVTVDADLAVFDESVELSLSDGEDPILLAQTQAASTVKRSAQ